MTRNILKKNQFIVKVVLTTVPDSANIWKANCKVPSIYTRYTKERPNVAAPDGSEVVKTCISFSYICSVPNRRCDRVTSHLPI